MGVFPLEKSWDFRGRTVPTEILGTSHESPMGSTVGTYRCLNEIPRKSPTSSVGRTEYEPSPTQIPWKPHGSLMGTPTEAPWELFSLVEVAWKSHGRTTRGPCDDDVR